MSVSYRVVTVFFLFCSIFCTLFFNNAFAFETQDLDEKQCLPDSKVISDTFKVTKIQPPKQTNQSIVVTFSKPLLESSIVDNFLVFDNLTGKAISGQINYDENTNAIIFTPLKLYDSAQVVSVLIKGGIVGITDTECNAMALDFKTTFIFKQLIPANAPALPSDDAPPQPPSSGDLAPPSPSSDPVPPSPPPSPDPAPAPAPAPSSATSSSGGGGGGGGCFIATSAFGSDSSFAVRSLRDFRDLILVQTLLGREFVQFYYNVSPAIAEHISAHEWLKPVVQILLLPFVAFSFLAVQIGFFKACVLMALLVLGFISKPQKRIVF